MPNNQAYNTVMVHGHDFSMVFGWLQIHCASKPGAIGQKYTEKSFMCIDFICAREDIISESEPQNK